jgi:hypothetical protein
MGLSIRAYAKHRGVSDTAVHKAIRAGRITPGPDGTIDPTRADAEWASNSVQQTSGTRQRATTATVDIGGATVTGNGGSSLLQARTVNEVVKAQTNRVKLERLRGELVDRSQAISHVFRLAREERDAWLNWPARVSAQMAATLNIDAHALHVALDTAVREHLSELGEIHPRVD